MTANTDVLEQAAQRPSATQGLGPTKSQVLTELRTPRYPGYTVLSDPAVGTQLVS